MKLQTLVTLFAIGSAGAFAMQPANVEAKVAIQSLKVTVTENGFEPKTLDVRPGTDVVLEVTRKTDSTCAKQVQVPSKKIKVDLPLNKTVSVALGKVVKGEIRFGCGMSMMESGQIFVR